MRDPSFGGMTSTQFLGAFNDNFFKQIVLLLCVDAATDGSDLQPVALALFALPFVLFSGFAGFLSDRISKRNIVVACKVGEVVVMALGVVAFAIGELGLLLAVLFCMGVQSAFFGPPKYGIMPEMLRSRDLPMANGTLQMTTFVAIIFGMALAGYSRMWFGDELWIVGAMCVGIGLLGTGTSLLVRRTGVAKPGLEFNPAALLLHPSTRRLLRSDRVLLGVLLVNSLFWFIGGLVQPAINSFGKQQLGMDDGRTSTMAACMGVGIAIGCILAGRLSGHRVRFGLVRLGAWGLLGCLAAVAALGASDLSVIAVERSCWGVLTLLGLFGGLFVVPLNVMLQSRPPSDQKGRMIGAMNLFNWVGILCSAGFFLCAQKVLHSAGWKESWTFAGAAVILLPVALFYRPAEARLE